jgi:hypothetical protein
LENINVKKNEKKFNIAATKTMTEKNNKRAGVWSAAKRQ